MITNEITELLRQNGIRYRTESGRILVLDETVSYSSGAVSYQWVDVTGAQALKSWLDSNQNRS